MEAIQVGTPVAIATRDSTRRSTIVRETKHYWVAASGAKFRKKDGRGPGDYTYGHPPALEDPDDEYTRRQLWETDLRRIRHAARATLDTLERAPEDLAAAHQLVRQAQAIVEALEAIRYFSPQSDTDVGETSGQ